MQRLLITATCLLVGFSCFSQTNRQVLSKSGAVRPNYREFFPKGYVVMDSTFGDMNKDGVADAVLVLQTVAESQSTEFYTNDDDDRYLLVVLKEPNGWRLVDSSSEVIECKGCGGVYGDPYEGISISPKGVLDIRHYGGSNWRWSSLLRYRYQKDGCYLIGEQEDFYFVMKQCHEDEYAGRNFKEVNYLTGERIRKKTSDDCEVLLDKKDKIPVKKLSRLSGRLNKTN
ncbi:MAG: hypothetical protein EBZ77_08070 [Chitinophagia bacterium]|nr:hypothetical protein [Chitinophagia bacterium]